jgi:cytochrome c
MKLARADLRVSGVLAKPAGTKMIFPGIKNEQQVKDLWAYVSQFDTNGNVKK